MTTFPHPDKVFNFLSSALKPLEASKLDAVWLDSKLTVNNNEAKYRLAVGDIVRVLNKSLVDGLPTHEIVSIKGNNYPPFKVELKCLASDEIIYITL